MNQRGQILGEFVGVLLLIVIVIVLIFTIGPAIAKTLDNLQATINETQEHSLVPTAVDNFLNELDKALSGEALDNAIP
jgi:hypothetical protein